ncbi:glycine zipper 2TM domain-containing protein [uncultured Paraglaciecola sp.]|uniref:glycine zipper 2TM domain-containing protein n=1 Tax=uncultured Paraglaciecola sp. TaxID=1765024 RepID=UPI0030D92052|tara:strand:- start:37928 stop:38452 length:525 start_codon:yes stop_codon:yes gene_type:complete
MKLLITSALLVLTFSPLASAKHESSYHNESKHSRGEFKARVIDSTPVYKYVSVGQPHTYCEPAKTQTITRISHDKGATIVGGIVGGIIGHAASDNKHKGLGTVAGAVLGSTLVHKLNSADIQTYKVKPQNCVTTHTKAQKVRVIDGYNVTYRSQGKVYQTFTQEKPAKYVRIYN